MATYDYTAGAAEPAAALDRRQDPKAARIRRMLGLPDLSRQPGSPVRFLLRRVLSAPCLAGMDDVIFPEILSTRRNFDLLNTPPDHPSRRTSDTFYVEKDRVLRTQTTSMWTWYLADSRVREKLERTGTAAAVSYGKVYRNDEIDRSHYPVFHQIDAVLVADRRRLEVRIADLDEVLWSIASVIYGDSVNARILDDVFPFTTPSRQLEVRWKGEWLEVVGAGLVHPEVLDKLNLDPKRYNGWAFGFGLDRLAMGRMDIPDIRILWSDDTRIRRQFESIDSRYKPVSPYPATERDIAFVVGRDRSVNDFYEIVRDIGRIDGESIVEAVRHLDEYLDPEKFGPDRVSHTFRVVYRSFLRTLTNDEINDVQTRIRESVRAELEAELR